MSGLVLSELERLAALEEAERTFPMTEEEFRAFYELTSRPVWVYLTRMTGDSRLADDLLQEAYYRLLRTKATFESDDHRRNYLYRIATNLVHDQRRRPRADREPLEDADRATARDVMTEGIHCCREDDDLAKAMHHMEKLKVRRLPVINKNKRMVGILSLGDLSTSASTELLSEWAKSVSAHHH